jgi:acetyltransferase
VLKIVSRNTPHKSAVGGVTIISAPDEAEAAYEELTKRGGAANREIEIEGVLVEEFVGEGIECVLSYTAETSFGPTLMFGVGGTGLDKATDVGFRLAPITRQEAREWVEDVASRTDSLTFGPEYADGISALVDAIVTIGDLADDPTEMGRLLELEMNPLLVQPQRVIALDAIATFERAGVGGATL